MRVPVRSPLRVGWRRTAGWVTARPLSERVVHARSQMLQRRFPETSFHGRALNLWLRAHRQSHSGLNVEARTWARTLIGLGVQPGEHVGILLTTRPEFVELLFGIAMAGAVAVPVNARYQPGELAYLVKDADLVVLATTGKVADSLDFAARLQQALPSLAGQADASVLVTFDPKNQRLTLKRVGSFQEGADHSLQLWALKSGGPQSLGVLGGDPVIRLTAAEGQVREVPALAISLEPKGGAPTGSGPTGPVLFKGALLQTTL